MKTGGRTIPGATEVAGRSFMYIESALNETFRQIVDASLETSSNIPTPKFGGIVEEKARLHLSDGASLLALSYKGDTQGWQAKLVAFCEQSGRRYGFLKDGQLFLSTGVRLSLEKLEVDLA